MTKDRLYLIGQLLRIWLGAVIGVIATMIYVHKLNALNQEVNFRIPLGVAMIACVVLYFVLSFLTSITTSILEHCAAKRKKDILLIIDIEKTRATSLWLELNGYNVTDVSLLDGKEAIARLIKSESFSVCVLDLAYKGHLDRALDLVEYIRKELGSHIPTILLTFIEGFQSEIFDKVIFKDISKSHYVLIETISHLLLQGDDKNES